MAAVRFLERVAETPELLAAETFSPLTALPLGDPVQPWPLLIDASLATSVREASESVFRLVRKAPRRAFAGSPDGLQRFYRGLEDPARVLRILELTDDLAYAIARTDMLLTTGGFRCVELNFTGGLGGWDCAVAAQALLGIGAIRSFVQDEGLDVRPANPLLDFLEHAGELAVQRGSADEDLNLAVMYRSDDPIPEDDPTLGLFGIVDAMYQGVLRALHGRRGRVSLVGCDDVVPHGGVVHVHGQRHHVLLEFSSAGMTDDFAARELAIVDERRTSLLNGRSAEWLGDKRTLALAWRLDAEGALDEEESAHLRRYVPWTTMVAPGRADRDGQQVDVLATIDAHRERSVLKRGPGSSGRYVVVGAETAPAGWDDAVRRALADGDWVVQELVDSIPLALQHGTDGWAMHRVVWGTFVLGGRAGGTFGRASPSDAGCVVNAARGSRDAVVLEVGRQG